MSNLKIDDILTFSSQLSQKERIAIRNYKINDYALAYRINASLNGSKEMEPAEKECIDLLDTAIKKCRSKQEITLFRLTSWDKFHQHLNKDEKEFLEPDRIREIIKKFCIYIFRLFRREIDDSNL